MLGANLRREEREKVALTEYSSMDWDEALLVGR